MGKCALKKWACLRALYEQWGVPIKDMQPVAGVQEKSIIRRVKAEGWLRSPSMVGLQNMLLDTFDNDIKRLSAADLDCEKQARALSVMAKTLESLATVNTRLSAKLSGSLNENKGASGASELVDNSTTANLLDQQLETLAKGLVGTGKDR